MALEKGREDGFEASRVWGELAGVDIVLAVEFRLESNQLRLELCRDWEALTIGSSEGINSDGLLEYLNVVER